MKLSICKRAANLPVYPESFVDESKVGYLVSIKEDEKKDCVGGGLQGRSGKIKSAEGAQSIVAQAQVQGRGETAKERAMYLQPQYPWQSNLLL